MDLCNILCISVTVCDSHFGAGVVVHLMTAAVNTLGNPVIPMT